MGIAWRTVAPNAPQGTPDGPAILRRALQAGRRLRRTLIQAAEADEPILLIVNDPDRSTQTRPVLAAIAEMLKTPSDDGTTDSGSRRLPRFRALIATGIHQFCERVRRDFERATFGDCGLDIEAIAWHDARDKAQLAPTGEFHLHRWAVESRFLLPIGSCEPHYFAGVTGPHKTLTIGCMSFEDIQANHAGAMSTASSILRLDGNPVYDGIERALRDLKQGGRTILAFGQVVCGDRIVAVRVGAPTQVLRSLLPVVQRTYSRTIQDPADIVRLRVPLPLGRSLYQADKAVKNNCRAVRPGGVIILEADCPDGVGPDGFLRLLRRANNHAAARRIVDAEGYRLGDHKAVKLRRLLDPAGQGVHLAVVSRYLRSDDLAGTGVEVFGDLEPALQWSAHAAHSPLRQGLIVEDAGMLTVTVARGIGDPGTVE